MKNIKKQCKQKINSTFYTQVINYRYRSNLFPTFIIFDGYNELTLSFKVYNQANDFPPNIQYINIK